MIKQHTKDEFYVKEIRGGYYGVIDGYDKSLASIEATREGANNECRRLNMLRNTRLNLI